MCRCTRLFICKTRLVSGGAQYRDSESLLVYRDVAEALSLGEGVGSLGATVVQRCLNERLVEAHACLTLHLRGMIQLCGPRCH